MILNSRVFKTSWSIRTDLDYIVIKVVQIKSENGFICDNKPCTARSNEHGRLTSVTRNVNKKTKKPLMFVG